MTDLVNSFSPISLEQMSGVKLMNRTDTKFVTTMEHLRQLLALARQDYREAVRLKYLQTLKQLTEGGHIDWQLHKTPTQYTYECTDEPFLRMTRHFLRIRYGNFEATAEIYEDIVAAQMSLKSKTSDLQPQEKGGDA